MQIRITVSHYTRLKGMCLCVKGSTSQFTCWKGAGKHREIIVAGCFYCDYYFFLSIRPRSMNQTNFLLSTMSDNILNLYSCKSVTKFSKQNFILLLKLDVSKKTYCLPHWKFNFCWNCHIDFTTIKGFCSLKDSNKWQQKEKLENGRKYFNFYISKNLHQKYERH